MVTFTRRLGEESGVQLNPLVDNSVMPTVSNADQFIGTIGRFSRGRIDKPMLVTRENIRRLLGDGESLRRSELNMTYVMMDETLKDPGGATGIVAQRLVSPYADIGWAYIRLSNVYENPTEFRVSDLTPAMDLVDPDNMALPDSSIYVNGSLIEDFHIAVRHLECFNDGIILAIHVPEVLDEFGSVADSNVVTLQILDSKENLLFSFTGSLHPDAVDEYGQSVFLEDVVKSATDLVEIQVSYPLNGMIDHMASDCYGYDENNRERWAKSDVLTTFVEYAQHGDGFMGYDDDDYRYASTALKNGPTFGYLSTGGSVANGLIDAIAGLSHELNIPAGIDVPSEVPAYMVGLLSGQLGLIGRESDHLLIAYWTPIISDCPAGINPRGMFPSSMYFLGKACGRNAVKNRYGFAKKNHPVAGIDFPLTRRNMAQTAKIESVDFSRMAKGRINPVVWDTFSDRSAVVCRDALTCSPDNSKIKLTSVADMVSDIDRRVTRFAKQALLKPMREAVRMTEEYLQDLFEDAEKSEWLVPGEDPDMQGKSFVFSVYPDPAAPYDRLRYSYSLSYDGAARQIEVTQSVAR